MLCFFFNSSILSAADSVSLHVDVISVGDGGGGGGASIYSYWLRCVGSLVVVLNKMVTIIAGVLRWSFVYGIGGVNCLVNRALAFERLLAIESSPLLLYAPSNVCCHQQDTSVCLFSR